MKKYARIYSGVIVELLETDGDISTMFHPDWVWVEVTDTVPAPAERWTAIEVDGAWSFASPAPPVPASDEIILANTAELQRANQLAAKQKVALADRIATLQDAIDNIGVEGMEEFAATPEEQLEFPKRKTQLTRWKNYAILLGRVTVQSGWALTVVWPVEPPEGMDLTVSAATQPEMM